MEFTGSLKLKWVPSFSLDFVEILFSTDDSNWYGVEQFEATINDGEGSNNIQRTFDVVVVNINDLPTIENIEDQTVNEDPDLIKIELVTEDLDNGIEISQDISVVVDPVNDYPILSNISDVSINEDAMPS